MDERQIKSITDFEFKADHPGTFTARVATLDKIDHDQDVTKAGAFPEGLTVQVSSYNHSSARSMLAPIGVAKIRSDGEAVFIDGEFNLDLELGKQTYLSLLFAKEHGVVTEWSYGFIATEFSFGMHDGIQVRFLEKLDVFEMSPVLKGAGLGTETLVLKSSQPYQEHVETVVAAVSQLVQRGKSLAEFRSKDGRTLSKSALQQLKDLSEELEEIQGVIQDLVKDEDLEGNKADDEEETLEVGKELLLQFEKIRTQLIATH
jgi:hypothetical protein